MKNIFTLYYKSMALVLCLLTISIFSHAQVIISQYYEGTSTNKWIELTNLGSTAVNTASPQLKLGIWTVSGSTGNIVISGAPTYSINLNVTIPAFGSVLIGNTANGTEVPYLNASSAAMTNNTVINFNGNDGIALLNASNVIIDQFGNGINATDISYVRAGNVYTPSSTFQSSQWISTTLASVQSATVTNSQRLGKHFTNSTCTTPTAQPTNFVFNTITNTSISASFTSTTAADEYLVLQSTSQSLIANPTDGVTYNAGNTIGNATVIYRGNGTLFSSSSLTANATYFYFVFSIKSTSCNSGPKYNINFPLIGYTKTKSNTNLNYYFGNFHSHSEYSDGVGLPSGNFGFADVASCMDFLGISEHNHVSAGMSLANWSLGRTQASSATNANFLALYGMEWGVISTGGHVIIHGLDSLIGWDAGQYQIYVPQTSYTGTNGLFERINMHGANAFATLAHPSNTDFNNIMTSYNIAANNAIVGTAVENGPATSTNTTYTDYPVSMSYLSYYRNLLAKGYHVGPIIDHDNHNVTHGHTAYSRTVVLSPSLSESDMLASMRLMRFYASEDCSAIIDFKINNNNLGSIITKPGAPNITVTTTTSSSITSIKLYSGVPGSGTNATLLTSSTSGTLNYTHTMLANLATQYYYIDITEANGKRIVTTPIWYTRNDAASAIAQYDNTNNNSSVEEFFPILENNKIIVKWVTINEASNKKYFLEKSYDNKNFNIIQTQESRGTSPYPTYYHVEDYQVKDNQTIYYRLTQEDEDGNVSYKNNIAVVNSTKPSFDIVTYPNPCINSLNVLINNVFEENTNIELFDIAGKRILSKPILLTSGEQTIDIETSSLQPGIYFIRIVASGHTIYKKVIKE